MSTSKHTAHAVILKILTSTIFGYFDEWIERDREKSGGLRGLGVCEGGSWAVREWPNLLDSEGLAWGVVLGG